MSTSTESIPEQFTGYAAFEAQGDTFDLKPHSYTPRAFTDDDVDIKVEASGICGSDIHMLRQGWGNSLSLPAIVGHEIVGKAVRVGKNSQHKVGDRIGFGAQCDSCGQCTACNGHLENCCNKKWIATYQGKYPDGYYTQGGYANYYRGPSRFAVKIPDEILPQEAAPLLCAGVTVFEPLKVHNVKPGQKVGVVGIGGLGHLAVQFAKALGADVYALTHSNNKEADILKLGATKAILTKDPKAVLAEYAGFFDLILITSFQNDMPLQDLYFPMIRPYGVVHAVGLPEGNLPPIHPRVLFAKSFSASLIGSPRRIEEMLAVAVKHNVRPWIETYPIEKAGEACTQMHQKGARYRIVLLPSA